MDRSPKRWIVIGLLALVILSGVALIWPGQPGGRGGRPGAGNLIAVLSIDGPIAASTGAEGLFETVAGADEIIEQLQTARDDPAIRAVVIRMNTPGGSPAASQEIGEAVRRLREAGKPVVVYIGDVAASGGYWIAATADRIVANPASLTGSIGVIMEITHVEDLYEKLGIEVETIKSGPYKDIGSPTRPLTEEERRLLQEMVNDVYQQFVDVVAQGRRLPRQQVLALADGRVMTGRQAKEAGLVDELGTFEDAVRVAASLARLETYELRDLREPHPLRDFLRLLGGARWPAATLLQDQRDLKLVRWELFRFLPR
ncbi:MAG: signal peptide peptidase SppA [Symbiobacteriaceae bacterium]|nr:MAG: signal peptide peptidase SppA [Bacillota bacterium]